MPYKGKLCITKSYIVVAYLYSWHERNVGCNNILFLYLSFEKEREKNQKKRQNYIHVRVRSPPFGGSLPLFCLIFWSFQQKFALFWPICPHGFPFISLFFVKYKISPMHGSQKSPYFLSKDIDRYTENMKVLTILLSFLYSRICWRLFMEEEAEKNRRE